MKHIIKFVLLVFIFSACVPSTPEPKNIESTYEYQDFAYDIAWSKDESILALTTLTGVYLYNSKTYEQLFIFEQTGSFGVVFGENYFASAGRAGVFVWDLENFNLIFQIPIAENEEFPSFVFQPENDAFVTSDSKQITLRELPSGNIIATIPTESMGTDIKFKSKDRLIIASSILGNIQEWDISTKKKIREFEFGKEVLALRLSEDANRVIVDYGLNGFELWDVTTGKIKHNYGDIVSASGWQRLSGNNLFVVVWGYAFDGQNSALSVWDLETHSKTQEFTTPFVNGDGWRYGSLNQDGSILVASNNEGYIYFYNLDTAEKIGEIFLPYKFVVEKG